MFCQVKGSTTFGINGVLIDVEVDIANGIPCFEIVGLPDTAVKESRERVRSAIKNSGLHFPDRRITVNLAPADMRKDSPGLDLPIAVGILAASGQLLPDTLQHILFIGELSLEGKIRGVSGVLPMVADAVNHNIAEIYLAVDNCMEAIVAGGGSTIYAPQSLGQLAKHLEGVSRLEAAQHIEQEPLPDINMDFSDVQGQFAAKRALEVAAAGGHNVLMSGPPGSGKTMLARRIPSILPLMSREEALEVAKIYSVADLIDRNTGLIFKRPFRDPHHTISDAGLIGGGRIPRPGEVTLSHNGVLFLDEFPEFSRGVIEVLRQPLEDGHVTISRVNASIKYPAKFMLVAAMNPCPCGFRGDYSRECNCTDNDIRRYSKKISGPLLDRIDIAIHVPRIIYTELVDKQQAEPSAVIRQRVQEARQVQMERLKKFGLFCNAQMNHKHIRDLIHISPQARNMMKSAFDKFALSARGYDRILKVAQTICDLTGEAAIAEKHIAESINLRSLQGK